MTALIGNYFQENSGRFWGMLTAHIRISLIALVIAVLIAAIIYWRKILRHRWRTV